MTEIDNIEQEKSVLRWGGLAGILGAILFILVFVIVIFFVGDLAQVDGWIVRFPEIKSVRTVENSLYLVALILWIPHFLALRRALGGTSLAPALFGSAIAISGVVVLAAGALPHVATTPLSDLYHAPGATPEERSTLVLMWQGTQGIFDALLIAGLSILPVGLLALGVAMLRAPAFGKGLAGVSIGLGVLGLASACVLLIDPLSPIAIVGFLSLIIFHIVVGSRVYRLSRVRPGTIGFAALQDALS